MADALHQFRAAMFTQFYNNGMTGMSVRNADSGFNQLMARQCRAGFFAYSIGEAVGADHDDGLEGVAEFSQVTFLNFS